MGTGMVIANEKVATHKRHIQTSRIIVSLLQKQEIIIGIGAVVLTPYQDFQRNATHTCEGQDTKKARHIQENPKVFYNKRPLLERMPMSQVTVRDAVGTERASLNLTRLRKTLYAPTQKALRAYAK